MLPWRTSVVPLAAALLVISAAAAADPAPVARARYLMGTICEARAFGDESRTGAALDAALDRIAALEQAMTTWRPDGELARWNAACAERPASVRVSPDLLTALDGARRWAEATAGLFDPTIGALASAWGLREGGRVPTDSELARAVERTSWRLFEIDRPRSSVRCLSAALELDLGGFGKGFALDEAARVLRDRGVESALLNFGGQVLALGAPPGEPGWVVEIAHPEQRLRPVAELTLRDASVATSSNAERGFEHDGRRYGHVLDPRTGRPVAWSAAVTVVARGGAEADALSTALLVAGAEEARRLLPRRAQFFALEGDGEGVRVTCGSAPLLRRLTWRDGARKGAAR